MMFFAGFKALVACFSSQCDGIHLPFSGLAHLFHLFLFEIIHISFGILIRIQSVSSSKKRGLPSAYWIDILIHSMHFSAQIRTTFQIDNFLLLRYYTGFS